jgi:hypothetical protein
MPSSKAPTASPAHQIKKILGNCAGCMTPDSHRLSVPTEAEASMPPLMASR